MCLQQGQCVRACECAEANRYLQAPDGREESAEFGVCRSDDGARARCPAKLALGSDGYGLGGAVLRRTLMTLYSRKWHPTDVRFVQAACATSVAVRAALRRPIKPSVSCVVR